MGNEPFVINRKSAWNLNKNLEVIFVEDWKPGVKRLHCRDLSGQKPEFWLVYCKDGFLPDPTSNRYAPSSIPSEIK